MLEDLDSLITSRNRSFFLNELDGFASNGGVVTVATTNHPERLDPAILDRPSRFDRKYHFDLPAKEERLAYIKVWNTSLKAQLQLSEEGSDRIAGMTEGYSFAYLKELFLSAMMGWINQVKEGKEGGDIEEVMASQVEVLKAQMVSNISAPEPEEMPAPGGMPVPWQIIRTMPPGRYGFGNW